VISDQQLRATLERLVSSLRAPIEAELRAYADELSRVAAERARAAEQATEAVAAEVRRQAQAQLAQIRDAARKQVEALRESSAAELDAAKRTAQAELEALRANAERELESARQALRHEIETLRRLLDERTADVERALAARDAARNEAEAQHAEAERLHAEAGRMRAEADRVRAEAERIRTEARAYVAGLFEVLGEIDSSTTLAETLDRVRAAAARWSARAVLDLADAKTAGTNAVDVAGDGTVSLALAILGEPVAWLRAEPPADAHLDLETWRASLALLARHAARVLEVITIERALGHWLSGHSLQRDPSRGDGQAQASQRRADPLPRSTP
jgi:hypothetical protein